MMCSMAENQHIENNFPIITKGETYTRVGESIVFQIKHGYWRYKRKGFKHDFYSRLGAVSYAVAYYTGDSRDTIKRLDDSLAKHKNDAMFHKYHLRVAKKKHDESSVLFYETRLELSIYDADRILNELRELSKAMNIV